MKRLTFVFIASLLPFLFLLVIEVLLRLFGVGQDYRLFITQGDHWLVNRYAAAKYFSSRPDLSIPDLRPQRAPLRKDPKALRVVCLGESSTAGFPFEVNINFPYFVGVRLQHLFPERRIEVLNLGAAAISSAVVLDFARALGPVKPDVALIYLGHNEFYGAQGTASTEFSPVRERLQRVSLPLLDLRIVQEVRALMSPGTKEGGRPTALMKALVAVSDVPAGSESYRITHERFETHLRGILGALREEGIHVVLGTLVSNLRDEPPLCFLAQGAPAELKATDPAAVAFFEGRALLAQGKMAEARSRFIAARDLDGLRFRASSDINRIIRRVAQETQTPLADVERTFDAVSENGIPGLDLFMEHVHPNPRGYGLIARAFVEAMLENGSAGLEKKRLERSLSDEEYLKRAGYTRLDECIGEIKTARLVQDYPFGGRSGFSRGPVDDEEINLIAEQHCLREIPWEFAHLRLGDHFLEKGEMQRAAREYQAVSLAAPEEPLSYVKLAALAASGSERAESERLLRHALALKADMPRASLLLGQVLLEMRRDSDAVAVLRELREKNSPQLSKTESIQARFLLSLAYARTGSNDLAEGVLREILDQDPSHEDARSLYEMLKKRESGRAKEDPLVH